MIKDTIHTLLQFAIKSLPRFEAEILLAHCLGESRAYLYTWPEREVSNSAREQFLELLQQRVAGVPVAYLLGNKEFWSLNLKVSKAVLIPRPETELIVEHLFKIISVKERGIRILDLGTGSGAIAIAIAKTCPHWRVVATDNSKEALLIAEQNARDLNLTNIEFYLGDWFSALDQVALNRLNMSSSTLNGANDQASSAKNSYDSNHFNYLNNAHLKFHAVVSNPPYIAAQDPHLFQGDLRFEPKEALIAGTDGLSDLKIIIENAGKVLENKGCLIVEHGATQKSAVISMMKSQGFIDITCHKDLANIDRVTLGFIE